MCVQDCMVIKSSSNYVPLMLFRFDKKNEVPILAVFSCACCGYAYQKFD